MKNINYIKSINLDGLNYQYCKNILLSLGLSENYILFNNRYFFGSNDIRNQAIINQKFEKISRIFWHFLELLYKKYSCEQLCLFFGSIYSNLEKIRIMNFELKGKNLLNEEIKNDIAYTCSVADLMGRKLKNLIEIIIFENNKRIWFNVNSQYYKRFIILLYYYSIFDFYNNRNHLSANYENGTSMIYVFPNNIDPINVSISEFNNIQRDNIFTNYDAGVMNNLNNDEFNRAFQIEKGISFVDYFSLMNEIQFFLKKKGLEQIKIEKKEFHSIIKKRYSNIDINVFCNECILTKKNLVSREQLYKNNGKYRLDTTPIIDIGKDYYIIVKSIIANSRNYWNNVYAIGLTPYTLKNNNKDKIIIATEKIIKNISKKFELEIKQIFENTINHDNYLIFLNKTTKDIFKNDKENENEWDCIVVDHNNHIIFNVEVKFINTSLTESGLANDLKRFFKKKGYIEKFEKRIEIINDNIPEFLNFCKADNTYKIEHFFITSKLIFINSKSNNRSFTILNYKQLQKYLLDNYYN